MNFNVNFNVPLNKYIVHPLVKLKDFDNKDSLLSNRIHIFWNSTFFLILKEKKCPLLDRNSHCVETSALGHSVTKLFFPE